jgi:hypothetical protein
MMSQRLCLFFAGYTCCHPSHYFGTKRLLREVERSDPETGNIIQSIARDLEEHSHESYSHLRTAASIANYFNIPTFALPQDDESYFPWMEHYIGKVEDRFPMNQIAYYYFFYSRRISELISSLRVVRAQLQLMVECGKRADLVAGANLQLQTAEYILFRLIAAAALLSSEFGHRFFNVFYQDINKRYAVFRNINVSTMSNGDLKAMMNNIDDYSSQVRKGIEKCICTLRELSY